VPLSPGSLRLGILVRPMPDPVEGSFYRLRDLPDAHVFLGCVLDAGGQVREWLEIWVQNVEGLAVSLANYREHFANSVLDQRWRVRTAILREVNPGDSLETGWNQEHPTPVFIDLEAFTAVPLKEAATQRTWELCQDDALLQAAGLPAFSNSLYRYLFQPGMGKASRFIPVVSNAPENDSTQSLAAILPPGKRCVPLNPQGGFITATRFYPMSIDEYLDVLGGKPWEPLASSSKLPDIGDRYAVLQAEKNYSGHFFFEAQGRAGRFAEVFHLKLQLISELFRLVYDAVRKTQLPFLNLSADSFRVRLAELSKGLPVLWTAHPALVRPGEALALPVKSTEHRYFIRPGPCAPSIYLPETLGVSGPETGTIRIRKVLPPERDGTVLEGTLVTQEAQTISPHDLLWMRFSLGITRVEIFGHAYAAENLSKGENRFRTLPQKLSTAVLEALQAAEGAPIGRSTYEVLPVLSSPCDLYALGVLAIRIFLVGEQGSLPVALDEMLSLARHVGENRSEVTSLPLRIRALCEKDERWLRSLGPQHLLSQAVSSEDASRWLPAELWYETLAEMVRLFAGMGPDSICRDFGDADGLALETVFQESLAAWRRLLIRSRSLIAIDWNLNREIRGVIEGLRNPMA
jgi:hypothetical protein